MKKYKLHILLAIPVILIGISLFGSKVIANVSVFQNFFSGNATASTTVAYLNPQAPAGTMATSSLYIVVDKNSNQSFDTASIAIQFTGSSTASVLAVQPEYALDLGIDCSTKPSACDWYGMSASSTPQGALQNFTDYRWTWSYASSTNIGSSTTNGANNRIFTLPTPTKYTRVLLYMTAGSLNGTVWSAGVGKRQINGY